MLTEAAACFPLFGTGQLDIWQIITPWEADGHMVKY